MQSNKKLLVFPTHRAIRDFISQQKSQNKLLPYTLSIDEFLKKVIVLDNKVYCESEQRLLFLNEAIKDIDIKKLGISKEFTKFLKQHEYIYSFFLEISSEKVEIDDIQSQDIYEYYVEHLDILKAIKINYEKILEQNNYIDRINLNGNYEINKNYLSKFDDIEIYFEGYFTKVEFDIIKFCANFSNLFINFYCNEYNKKSISIFNELFNCEFILNYEYKVNLSNKQILEERLYERKTKNIQIKSFSSRINQIAFIKDSITKAVKQGIEPENIVVVLPDEKFATSIQLFDIEKYFNYAMGKSIKNYKLYQVSYAIYSYLNEEENKDIENLKYLNIEKNAIDETLKKLWNKKCTKEILQLVTDYIRNFESNKELLEKFDELLYKLNILLFSNDVQIKLKDVYKIFLQKLSSISLDDVSSGKITVLGLLETRMMQYDCVIICDFNEDYIPKISLKDKFLSTKIKQKVGLPTTLHREALQKYYYKRLCDNTKYIYVSYVQNEQNQISRFANELFKGKIPLNMEDNFYKHILYQNQKINYSDEKIVQKIDLTKFIWSATSLKTYLQCKRKFYLQYILKLKEHNISLKPKAYELGDIIHSILEDYYNQDVRSFSKIEELFLKYKSKNSFLTLDLEIWKRKLHDFYLKDSKRLEDRKLLFLEKEFNISFEGINIKGFVDRVDLYGDTYEVIDYKTSSVLKVDSARTYEKAVDFQLEFYFLAMSEFYKTDKIECFYYDLQNNILKKEEMLDKKLELLVEKFNEIKEESQKEISFNKCEDKSNCLYCSYKTICNED